MNAQDKHITVTSPLLPDLDELHAMLQQVWDAKWITNNGRFHQQLEQELAAYLGVPYLSLFTNGTSPMIAALQLFGLQGEVITSPYSFVASANAIVASGCTPVFVDVDPLTGNLDPDKIEAAITPRTSAIMPVHIYGQPCDTMRIQQIADQHGLKVIYDGAHTFGVMKDGRSILNEGDVSTISFHATKVFNTIEGGAMILKDAETKARVDHMNNFGFADEAHIDGPGVNNKMDEIRCAYGLLNLRQADKAIGRRKEVARQYVEGLKDVEGIRVLPCIKESFAENSEEEVSRTRLNYAYFPIFVDEAMYGQQRDVLYDRFVAEKIYCRKYFYPLISDFSYYHDLPSAQTNNLTCATHLAESVICLPIHHDLHTNEIERIINIIRNN